MTAHLLITGSVQGVGFRKFVKYHARKLSLTGWVRNLPDGSVEAVVNGEEDIIKKLIAACQKGPFLATVANLHITWEDEMEAFEEFIIHKE